MSEQKAVYYGQVELIPGIICDGYVLDDGTAVMSERGTADLLRIDQRLLNRMRTNWPPKSLESFIDKGLSMRTNLVEVLAKNSPYQGRKIVIYDSAIIENLIRSYVLALANRKLRENQRHIGEQCAILLTVLVQTALEATIKEACGFIPEIQKTAQKNYIDTAKLIQELGFQCSLPNQIATKKDILKFLQIPEGTLNSFLYKHSHDIQAIRLDSSLRKFIGCKATRINGYKIDDVVKIAVGMDTAIGIEIKKKMFGQVGLFASPKVKDEIQWRQTLSKVFAGFDLHYNYPVGKYRVDFFVEQFMMVLECNGYEHRYYEPKEEMEREKIILEKYSLVRFHHKISLETLFNGILKAKSGQVIRLDSDQIVLNCL